MVRGCDYGLCFDENFCIGFILLGGDNCWGERDNIYFYRGVIFIDIFLDIKVLIRFFILKEYVYVYLWESLV